MGQLQLKPVFVHNHNVRNFQDLMKGLMRLAGEGRMACIWGRAGRGKTRTVQWWHSQNESVYLRMRADWKHSRAAFARALARELGFLTPPWSTSQCLDAVITKLTDEPIPVFIDEPERLGRETLETIRDLTDLTGAPFVLLGEEELYDWMARERRVWSRTAEQMEFLPWSPTDVIVYAGEAAGLRLCPEAAEIFHRSADGDIRIIKRDLGTAVRILNANGAKPDGLTPDIARSAVKAGMKGRDRRPK